MAAPQVTTTAGIPKTVDTNMSITTKEQALDLDNAFNKAFGPLHDLATAPAEPSPAKEEPKPEDKGEEKETKEEAKPDGGTGQAPAPEAKPETPLEAPVGGQQTEPAPATHPDDEPDEELDKVQLHPDSRPETVEQFRELRGLLKTERKLAKELRERVQKGETEMASLRGTVRPVNDPEVQKELEALRTFRLKHQIYDDSIYQTNYEQPVQAMFNDVINDIKSLAPDKEAGEAWEKEVRAAGVDGLDRSYWNDGVISQCSDPLHKERLVRKISLMLEGQEKRNQFRSQMSANPQAYERFRTEQAADYWKNFSSEAEDEATKIIPTLGEWAAPKDVALAKTPQERAAWEAHNNTYKEYENVFQRAITDAATQGPRGMTRVAVQAVLAERYKRENESLSTQLKKAQAELRIAQEELNKIAGVRSRVAQASGTNSGARTETKSRKVGMSVDDAFREYGPGG